MVRLTHKQTDVGSVLHDGSCLLQQSSLAEDERRSVDNQLTLLSNRWEELRLRAMDRQARFAPFTLIHFQHSAFIIISAKPFRPVSGVIEYLTGDRTLVIWWSRVIVGVRRRGPSVVYDMRSFDVKHVYTKSTIIAHISCYCRQKHTQNRHTLIYLKKYCCMRINIGNNRLRV